jgi:hypothetical protein
VKIISEYLRDLAGIVAAEGMDLHEIMISFFAPDPKKRSTETMTIEKDKEFEANFQWLRYSVLFSDADMNWYAYTTPLTPNGKKPLGGQEVYLSDTKFKVDKTKVADIEPTEVERAFPNLLKGPNLKPEARVNYVLLSGVDANARMVSSYGMEEFRRIFVEDGFYKLITKGMKIVDPFGKQLGVKGQPSEEKKS